MAGADEGGKLRRLPSGRHGLPPEFVDRNHRERLTAGAIAAIAEHGFRDAGVTQIAAAAGVSRRTFYDFFSSKEECYFDTYAMIEEHLLQLVMESAQGGRGWTAKVRARVLALVDVLALNPDLVRFTLLAPPTAGGTALERERVFLRRLLASLTEGAPSGRGHAVPSDEELEALAGAVSAVLTASLGADAASDRAGEVPHLVEMVLVPIIGRRRASAEAEKTRSQESDL